MVGNTEVGIEARLKGVACPVILSSACVPELRTCADAGGGLRIGACVSLTAVGELCDTVAAGQPACGAAAAIRDMLRWFASVQIRNVACVGGNLATASPISDLNPLLAACGATLTIASAARGERQLPVADFFKGC